jgi:glutathione S-transferase
LSDENMLVDNNHIQTSEVKEWHGLHLLYYPLSSCSQKVRILLKEKNIAFVPHIIDLKKGQQTTPWFLGINARGVVPVLIDDGQVHIESNDILCHLDQTKASDQESFLPKNLTEKKHAERLLSLEDITHDHLRVVTMHYLAPSKMMRKSNQHLKAYEENGAQNTYREQQVKWWRQFSNEGISEHQIHMAIECFHSAFLQLHNQLKNNRYLLGEQLSVVDISWFITLHRLVLAGYPLHLYSHLDKYYQTLLKRPHFRSEVNSGSIPIRVFAWLTRTIKRLRGPSLSQTYHSILAQ